MCHVKYGFNVFYFSTAENKFSVTLTASATSTIVEEFIQLLRKMHSSTEWTDMFNAFLIKKLAVAADCLTHSSFSVQVC